MVHAAINTRNSALLDPLSKEDVQLTINPIVPVKKLITAKHNKINAEGIPLAGRLNSKPSIINSDAKSVVCPTITNMRIVYLKCIFEYNAGYENLNSYAL